MGSSNWGFATIDADQGILSACSRALRHLPVISCAQFSERMRGVRAVALPYAVQRYAPALVYLTSSSIIGHNRRTTSLVVSTVRCGASL